MTRKKTKTGKRTSAAKSRGSPKNVDEYLASVPRGTRGNFARLRAAILSVVPADAAETISYGIPAIKGKRVLVWFAAFSSHCSLFPSAAVIDEFKDQLKNFTTSKGTVQFPNDKSLPTALVKRLVKARVAQTERKKRR